MKYIFFLLFFLLQFNLAFGQDFAKGDTVYVTSDTYIIPKPEFFTKDDAIAEVPKGTKKVVKQVSADGNYVKVQVGENIGWLYFSFITDWSTVKSDIQRKKEKAKNRNEYLRFLREKGYGILLKNMSFSTNSADGVTTFISFKNINPKKTIKYIKFTFTPYNTVGDLAYGDIKGQSTQTARGVGPISPDESASYSFDNLWYNGTIGCIEVRKIRVEYMNGTSFTYINDLKDIRKHARNIHLRGECKTN